MHANLYSRVGIVLIVAMAAGAIVLSKKLKTENVDESTTLLEQAKSIEKNESVEINDEGGISPPTRSADAGPQSHPVSKASTASSQLLPRLLDLGADKCVPCKMMAPILEELREDFVGRFDVMFIDVWKNPEAAKLHRVQLIPTQIFFDDSGRELARHEGFFSREDILQKWRELGYSFNDEQSQSDVENDDSPDAPDAANDVVNENTIGVNEAMARDPDWWIEVIYLHPTMRCHDCLLAEENVGDAVHELFADEVAVGYLRWRAVDYESREHQEYAEALNVIEGSELVLACVSDDGIECWETVPNVLEFGHDKPAAVERVRDAVTTFERTCQTNQDAAGDGSM